MDFQHTINYKIADLSAVHRTELEKALAETGVHSGRVFILFELWKDDGLSQIELSKRLRLSAPTVNKMVRGLADSSFVKFSRSESDARIVNVFLTEKGAGIKPRIENVWQNFEQQLTANLTETERLILLQLLDKILVFFYNDPKIDTNT